MSRRFQVPIEARVYEVDTQGHLTSAVYLQYAEHARWAWLERQGIGAEDLLGSGVGPVVLEQRIRHHREVRAGETVLVGCVVDFDDGQSPRVFGVHQDFRSPEGDLVADLYGVFGLLDLRERRLIDDPRGHLATLAGEPHALAEPAARTGG